MSDFMLAISTFGAGAALFAVSVVAFSLVI